MKNSFGNNVTITIFGESHGSSIGVVLDGLSSGIPIDEAFIAHQLTLRRPSGRISTSRVEADEYVLESGVFNGYTTGTPICIRIPNTNTRSKDYSATRYLARPSHADLTAEYKYAGYQDYRGGGHFSGRITAGLVAAGAIALSALKTKGISLGTHISRIKDVKDRPFADYQTDIAFLNQQSFPFLDEQSGKSAKELIEELANNGDSCGGVLETAVINLPAGVGEPWFDSVESLLAHGLFAIPAVKGVEFGSGFGFADLKGSQANDPFCMKGDKIVTVTNHNGGINGGISNGMPIIFRTVIKPTPSIYKKQSTVDFARKEDTVLQIAGRHDPAIIHRARVVVDSITALVLCDLLETFFGENYFTEKH